MDLLTIENLCIAAEATIVLLLLAFAWRPVKELATSEENNEDAGEGLEASKNNFLSACLYQGLYLQKWTQSVLVRNSQNVSSETPYLFASGEHNDFLRHNVPEPWQDRLTGVLNKQGFDAVLDAWLNIQDCHRSVSTLSVITLNTYSALLSTHGAMSTECILRAVAKQISDDHGSTSLIARYQPDRFVLLHYSASLQQCHNHMQEIQKKLSSEGFCESAGKSIAAPCIVSAITNENAQADLPPIEKLIEGCLHAEEHKLSVVSFLHSKWTDTIEDIEPSQPASHDQSEKPIGNVPRQEVPRSVPTQEITDSEIVSQSIQVSDAAILSPAVSPNDAITTAQAAESNDISAVASADDIAALFAQINNNKTGNSEPPSSIASPPTPAPAIAVEPPRVPLDLNTVDKSEAATSDDIAALFQAVKPNVQPPAATMPLSTTVPAAVPAVSESVTQDDIASLFATVQSAVKAPPAVSTTEEINPSDAATPDDIASLFATIKPNIPVTSTPTNTPAVAAPAAETSKVEEIDLHEAATADDIASLFATVKPNVAVPSPATTTPAVTPPLSQDTEDNHQTSNGVVASTSETPIAPTIDSINKAETATPDDIASLFAMAKGNHLATAAATSPIRSASELVPPAMDAGDLTQAATQDDIASLFASIQPNTPAKVESVQVPLDKPTATNPTLNLNETATADDIASLFAMVKGANTTPANQTTA